MAFLPSECYPECVAVLGGLLGCVGLDGLRGEESGQSGEMMHRMHLQVSLDMPHLRLMKVHDACGTVTVSFWPLEEN